MEEPFAASAEVAESMSWRPLVATVPGVNEESAPIEKRMRLRYSGECRVCSLELPAKAEAIYEGATKTVRCVTHDLPVDSPSGAEVVEAGTPGASARCEFERRKARREERTRTRHP